MTAPTAAAPAPAATLSAPASTPSAEMQEILRRLDAVARLLPPETAGAVLPPRTAPPPLPPPRPHPPPSARPPPPPPVPSLPAPPAMSAAPETPTVRERPADVARERFKSPALPLGAQARATAQVLDAAARVVHVAGPRSRSSSPVGVTSLSPALRDVQDRARAAVNRIANLPSLNALATSSAAALQSARVACEVAILEREEHALAAIQRGDEAEWEVAAAELRAAIAAADAAGLSVRPEDRALVLTSPVVDSAFGEMQGTGSTPSSAARPTPVLHSARMLAGLDLHHRRSARIGAAVLAAARLLARLRVHGKPPSPSSTPPRPLAGLEGRPVHSGPAPTPAFPAPPLPHPAPAPPPTSLHEEERRLRELRDELRRRDTEMQQVLERARHMARHAERRFAAARDRVAQVEAGASARARATQEAASAQAIQADIDAMRATLEGEQSAFQASVAAAAAQRVEAFRTGEVAEWERRVSAAFGRGMASREAILRRGGRTLRRWFRRFVDQLRESAEASVRRRLRPCLLRVTLETHLAAVHDAMCAKLRVGQARLATTLRAPALPFATADFVSRRRLPRPAWIETLEERWARNQVAPEQRLAWLRSVDRLCVPSHPAVDLLWRLQLGLVLLLTRLERVVLAVAPEDPGDEEGRARDEARAEGDRGAGAEPSAMEDEAVLDFLSILEVPELDVPTHHNDVELCRRAEEVERRVLHLRPIVVEELPRSRPTASSPLDTRTVSLQSPPRPRGAAAPAALPGRDRSVPRSSPRTVAPRSRSVERAVAASPRDVRGRELSRAAETLWREYVSRELSGRAREGLRARSVGTQRT